ncbi:pyridoxamine 5'-phosphate oxidase [Alkaliphilus pronyensis]|uniref:Pyridoxamine 5'-phosphate oxidase n=1 Tax=Alkaliphilus pronyensis TaxID=1482732 RepID=A0A6I0FDW4_9FIRM|nr:pyridoxamine 5'-phosphate oxidase family protein [Alkaliphilus pronyensis]KAB3538532.1 pyridoxamine 5'-phosphate oxidase [Alkaliphilus pronyensis]
MRNPESTIANLIDSQGTSFISSVDSDGYPTTRAMLQPRHREGIRRIYYSTNTSSSKIAHFRSNPKACLYFYDRRLFKGVMLKGVMEVLEEKEIKEFIWRDGDDKFYPLGVTDPDYCVLKFTAISGRSFSNLKSENFKIE